MEKMREVRIVSLLGLPDLGRKQAIRCPHGNSDKTPSCYIFPDNGFKCFSCGASGQNAIDFLESFEGVGFKEALLELSEYI